MKVSKEFMRLFDGLPGNKELDEAFARIFNEDEKAKKKESEELPKVICLPDLSNEND